MDRNAAEVIMRHTNAVDLLLGAMGELKCVTTMHEESSRPIAQIYPDLHPDKDKM